MSQEFLLSTYMYDSQLSIGTVVLLWLVVLVQPHGNEGATVAALRKQHRGHGCLIQFNLKEKYCVIQPRTCVNGF
jgi:hypothetical protein